MVYSIGRNGLLFLWLGLALGVLGAQSTSPPLPTLTTIGAVHRLTYAEARRGYPVHLNAVICYYDPYLNHPRPPVIMASDSTSSIYVGIPNETSLPLHAGTLLEIRGQSSPGDFAPSIIHAQIRVLGEAPLPTQAPRQTLTHLLTGSEDAQWVEMEGVVRSVEISGSNVTLALALSDGTIAATTVGEPGVDYGRLIDAKVKIRGIAGSLYNHHNQIFGVQLLFPGLATVKVETPAPAYPFDLPITPISSVMRYTPGKVSVHRVHIRGTVTLFWPGRMLCIQNGAEALCADTGQTTPLVPGEQADLIGFPGIGNVVPTLSNAIYDAVPAPHPINVTKMDARQGLSGEQDAQLVQMEARVIARQPTSLDPTLIVSSDGFTFPVVLPKAANGAALLDLPLGSKLRVTGICSVHVDPGVFTRHDGYPVPKYFLIMLRSPADLVVLEKPSWWTPQHTLSVLALALGVTLCVLCWVVYLRIRVKQQTELLRHQASHDALTGLWNRKAILDLLRREFELASRANQRVGVLMLDADYFKQVNDTFGHLAGDAVLKEFAQRIQQALRSYDLSGRWGGEEFLIVLPNCLPGQIEDCAERVRASIADLPFHADGAVLKMTASIGWAVLNPLTNTQRDALAAADSALYQAKHSGRNRVVSADPVKILDTNFVDAVT